MLEGTQLFVLAMAGLLVLICLLAHTMRQR